MHRITSFARAVLACAIRFSVARFLFLAILPLAALPPVAHAQERYPDMPIHIVYPFAAGGSGTVLAQLLAEQLNLAWGVGVVTEPRPGGNTIIGSDYVARATPDGSILLLANSAHAINPSLLKTPYDAIRDFAPVATLVHANYVLVASPSSPANTLSEFIALAKAQPGTLNFGSTGNGSVPHLLSAMFLLSAGVKINHIPYKGSAAAMVDLIGGRIQMYFTPPDVAAPLIKSGKIKALAITGNARSSLIPQVPTFAEAGLANFKADMWFGVFAPAKTPKAIVQKLSTQIGKLLQSPEVQAKLTTLGFSPFISTPGQFSALIKSDIAGYARLIKTAGIHPDE